MGSRHLIAIDVIRDGKGLSSKWYRVFGMKNIRVLMESGIQSFRSIVDLPIFFGIHLFPFSFPSPPAYRNGERVTI